MIVTPEFRGTVINWRFILEKQINQKSINTKSGFIISALILKIILVSVFISAFLDSRHDIIN